MARALPPVLGGFLRPARRAARRDEADHHQAPTRRQPRDHQAKGEMTMPSTPKKSLEITTPSDEEIRITRSFDAPRMMVWDAYTRPELLKRWLGAMPGWSWAECEMDVREGGKYRWVWRGPEGAELGLGGVYREVVPGERLVSTERYDQPWYEGEAVGTVVFTRGEGPHDARHDAAVRLEGRCATRCCSRRRRAAWRRATPCSTSCSRPPPRRDVRISSPFTDHDDDRHTSHHDDRGPADGGHPPHDPALRDPEGDGAGAPGAVLHARGAGRHADGTVVQSSFPDGSRNVRLRGRRPRERAGEADGACRGLATAGGASRAHGVSRRLRGTRRGVGRVRVVDERRRTAARHRAVGDLRRGTRVGLGSRRVADGAQSADAE